MRRSALAASIVAVFLLGFGGAAFADWRESFKVLRIGFLAASDPATDIARLEPFLAYIESRLSLPVELIPATTEAGLIDAAASGRVQYAILSATGYATAAALCSCVEPLVLPAAFDGSRGFYSVLLARADGAIHTLADSDGARLAISAPDSVAGRLVPLQALAAAGIDPATHFSAIYQALGPVDAVAALLDGRADVAIGWSSLAGDPAAGYSFGVLADMVAAGRLDMDQVRVVWQSGLIPFGPHTVRKDMPPELRDLLRDALTAMAGEAPDVLDAVDNSSLGGGGFVAASAEDYAVVDALVAPVATPATAP